jgi:hypothetical protein
MTTASEYLFGIFKRFLETFFSHFVPDLFYVFVWQKKESFEKGCVFWLLKIGAMSAQFFITIYNAFNYPIVKKGTKIQVRIKSFPWKSENLP